MVTLTTTFFMHPSQGGIPEYIEHINSFYVHDVYHLPPVNDSLIMPDKITQSSGHISGWIDIVGYRQMARINGTDYIKGKPEDNAEVRYDAWADLTCKRCGVDSITKEISITTSGSQTIATMEVKLWWWYISCGIRCIRIYKYESATFQDTDSFPEIYNYPGQQNAVLEQYRANPRNLLRFDNLTESIMAYRVVTQNGSVEHWFQIGMINLTDKGIPYMNLTSFPGSSWNNTGTGINHFGEDVLMENTTFYANFYTPFGTAPRIPLNITTTKMPETSVDFGVFKLMYVVLVFLIGIYIMCKSAR